MAVNLLQVTLGSAATQISTQQTLVRQIIIQDNAAHNVRVGDNTVSATKGILLASASPAPGGSLNSGPMQIYFAYLSDWYLFGTAGDLIDILYIT